uniref:Uncharacterized protein n=1 Tax=Arundo donax TaxID=35708 RepID=A0A0A9FWZ9_ARUDO
MSPRAITAELPEEARPGLPPSVIQPQQLASGRSITQSTISSVTCISCNRRISHCATI